MATGKSVNLRVRPLQSTDLCFTVDGVIVYQVAPLLGTQVLGFDVRSLYRVLGDTVPNLDEVLQWGSDSIYTHFFDLWTSKEPTMLCHLRNTNEAADLDRAIGLRQNSYITSYSPKVLEKVKEVYYDDPQDPNSTSPSRYRLLTQAEKHIVETHKQLNQAYLDDNWGVRKSTRSVSENLASQTPQLGSPITFEGTTSTDSFGFDYRHPQLENDLRYTQSRAAVRQEILNAWRMSEMCDNAYITFPNELRAIDLGIRRLQTAYIDTFLFSPFGGTVTALYHGDGDFVRAGEPILRVENDLEVYLVGTVKYRGMIRIGSSIKVTTTLFEAAGAATTSITGDVVAVRGHDAVSEQWEIMIRAPNRITGQTPFPLNYSFDFESTTIEVLSGP